MILHTPAGTFVVHISYAPAAGLTMVGLHADNGQKCAHPCIFVQKAATVHRYFKDRPCKIVGRKAAFKAAIADFDKPTRTLLWDAFKKSAQYMRPRA
jgi:hypothetical protein